MKLEHGKSYNTNYGEFVGPLIELHDGRFAWKVCVWRSDGSIATISGQLCGDEGWNIESEAPDSIQDAPECSSPNDKLNRAAATFLDKVKDVVTGPREKEYGDKTENHARIAKLWNMWLTETKEDGDAITPYDVATMMLMVKLARLMQSPGHQDSHIDIAGYAACMEEIYDRQ